MCPQSCPTLVTPSEALAPESRSRTVIGGFTDDPNRHRRLTPSSGTAGVTVISGDAVAGAAKATAFLDVEVQQLAKQGGFHGALTLSPLAFSMASATS